MRLFLEDQNVVVLEGGFDDIVIEHIARALEKNAKITVVDLRCLW